jgi:hypothetical protein
MRGDNLSTKQRFTLSTKQRFTCRPSGRDTTFDATAATFQLWQSVVSRSILASLTPNAHQKPQREKDHSHRLPCVPRAKPWAPNDCWEWRNINSRKFPSTNYCKFPVLAKYQIIRNHSLSSNIIIRTPSLSPIIWLLYHAVHAKPPDIPDSDPTVTRDCRGEADRPNAKPRYPSIN